MTQVDTRTQLDFCDTGGHKEHLDILTQVDTAWDTAGHCDTGGHSMGHSWTLGHRWTQLAIVTQVDTAGHCDTGGHRWTQHGTQLDIETQVDTACDIVGH